MAILEKQCSRCKNNYALTEENFYKRKDRKIGFYSICKSCSTKRCVSVSNNSEKIKKYRDKYRSENRGSFKEYRDKYYDKNKEILRQRKNYRYKNDLEFRILDNLRSRIHVSVVSKVIMKLDHTAKLLGCSISDFVKYLENLFSEGMTWENHGIHGWHIDHIIPCAAFNLTNEEEQRKCFHYTNINPYGQKKIGKRILFLTENY